MSDVPTEIHLEILRRVPVESLFRFRSVCKTWRDMIDNPNFAKQHIHRGIGGQWFFQRHEKGKIFLSSIKELTSNRSSFVNATNVKILGGAGVPRLPEFSVPTCNGLILLSSFRHKLAWRIWNPFTGESLELGKCNDLPDVMNENSNLATSGIGYDEANDDYKVVRIVRFNTFVYSVNLKMWRKVGNFPNSLIGHVDGVFAYGALHWNAYSKERNGSWGWIVAFDTSTEIYRKIALPSELTEVNWYSMNLHALGECLFLSCTQFRGKYFVMWKIKDYGCGETWTKVISVESVTRVKPIAYLPSKGRVLLHRHGWEYLWYDMDRSSAENLTIEINVENSIWYDYTTQVFPASIVRLKTSDVNGASQGTSRRKRRRRNTATAERLPLKVLFDDPEDIPPSDDVPASSNAPAVSTS